MCCPSNAWRLLDLDKLTNTTISNIQMNMHDMQSIEKNLKRDQVALLLFIKKYCQIFSNLFNLILNLYNG
jgi:hypothetical protein